MDGVALPTLVLALMAFAPRGQFDTPLARDVVQLPADAYGLAGKLTCAWYPGVLVKELDRGEKGAERLSLVRFEGKRAPPCAEALTSGEIVIEDWSGYFSGVRSRFVFFSADDYWEGGSVGFAVYDAHKVEKVLEDAAVGDLALDGANGRVRARFRRAWRAECSLPSDGEACWATVRKALGLAGPAPDCATAYARAKADPSTPSVFTYDAEIASLAARTVRPRRAPRVECVPAT